MRPITPGPSWSESGWPVHTTGSPTVRPEVSSYTWMVAWSPSRRMISPTSFVCPTRTSSYICEPDIFAAITTGPETE